MDFILVSGDVRALGDHSLSPWAEKHSSSVGLAASHVPPALHPATKPAELLEEQA